MRFRPKPGLTAAALAAFVLLCGLGTWQVQRLVWKDGLIAERRAALALPPVAVSQLGPDPAPALRRVTATGTFQHRSELHLVARTFEGRAGIEVVTPLLLARGGVILVDRGWVPQQRADPAARPEGQVAGTVTVEGVLRRGGRPSRWTPDNRPEANEWYFLDIGAMSAAAGIAPDAVLPYVLAAGAAAKPGGLPRGRAASAELPNPHLGYAIAWYALAAALVVIYLMVTLRRDRTP